MSDSSGLRRTDLDLNPIKQFEVWFNDAWAANIEVAHAMTLATATQSGVPSARMILMASFDARGFVFYTSERSPKGVELAANPVASLLFHWQKLGRQVRISGSVGNASQAETEAYFLSRPFGSRLNASLPGQSQVIPDRAAVEAIAAQLQARHPDGNLPVPDHMSGYRLAPEMI
jgi:pyridoxamine 5'-phosphate oxidase